MSDELDDLRDFGGRARRTVVATAVGVALAALAVKTCLRLVRGCSTDTDFFVLFCMVLTFAAGFTLTRVVLDAWAARRWRAQRIPQAKLR